MCMPTKTIRRQNSMSHSPSKQRSYSAMQKFHRKQQATKMIGQKSTAPNERRSKHKRPTIKTNNHPTHNRTTTQTTKRAMAQQVPKQMHLPFWFSRNQHGGDPIACCRCEKVCLPCVLGFVLETYLEYQKTVEIYVGQKLFWFP